MKRISIFLISLLILNLFLQGCKENLEYVSKNKLAAPQSFDIGPEMQKLLEDQKLSNYSHLERFIKGGFFSYKDSETCLSCHDTIRVLRDKHYTTINTSEEILSGFHFSWLKQNQKDAGNFHSSQIPKRTSIDPLHGTNAVLGWSAHVEDSEHQVVSIGCGRCHVGGLVQYLEKPNNEKYQSILSVDCLVCHADQYDLSKRAIKEVSPGRFEWDYDRSFLSAITSTLPKNKNCLRCHKINGYSKNLHISNGIKCIDCHTSGSGHLIRNISNTTAVGCSKCHSELPHYKENNFSAILNSHTKEFSCQVCHQTGLDNYTSQRDWTQPTLKNGVYFPGDSLGNDIFYLKDKERNIISAFTKTDIINYYYNDPSLVSDGFFGVMIVDLGRYYKTGNVMNAILSVKNPTLNIYNKDGEFVKTENIESIDPKFLKKDNLKILKRVSHSIGKSKFSCLDCHRKKVVLDKFKNVLRAGSLDKALNVPDFVFKSSQIKKAEK